MSAPSTDEQDALDMNRLSSGNDTALNELMDRHAEKLHRYLVRSLQNVEDADDLSQETFVRVYQNRSRFDSSQKFSTWLYAIASNLVRDRYRWRSRHPQVSLDAEHHDSGSKFRDTLPGAGPSPDESEEANDRAKAISRAVGALPEDLRQPLILAEYDDLSHAEIAEILGCTVKAVETRIYRARNQLRSKLGGLMASA